MLPNCYHCGGPGELPVEDGSAVCEACEKEYQAFLDVSFPHGQCGTCGAAYAPVTCHLGQTHVVAHHVEGGCGNWTDTGGFELGPDECLYGCRPAVTATRQRWYADDQDLPF